MTEAEQKWVTRDVTITEDGVVYGEPREIAAPPARASSTSGILAELSAAETNGAHRMDLFRRAGERIRELETKLSEEVRAFHEAGAAARKAIDAGRAVYEDTAQLANNLRGDLVVARRDVDQWARAYEKECEAHEATNRQLQSELDAPRAASKPAASRQSVLDALDALVSALDHTRPHTKEDHPGIVRAIDALVVARIAEWAAGEGEKKT